MKIKMIEIRDRATLIAAVAIKMEADGEAQERFLGRCGYPWDGAVVALLRLDDMRGHVNPDDWSGRTMPAAHQYVYDNFDTLEDGQVVDVEVILGEKDTPKEPEIYIP